MRIASLVPSATELMFALGLGGRVVGVTHECDFPPEAAERAHLTRTVIPEGLSAAEIDAEVRRVTSEGRALYELDAERLESLGVDLILTQEVCRVCAVSHADVEEIAARLPARPRVVSLDPSTLGEVLEDVTRAAEAAGEADAGVRLRDSLELRLKAVREAVAGVHRPGAIALEWMDPPFAAGHWLPEMVEAAGGRELLGAAGARSEEVAWADVVAARPETVFSVPCGWGLERALSETRSHTSDLAATGAAEIYALDAAASFSRPGPRLVDGTELLAHLLHPDRVPDPGTIPFARVDRLSAA